jgi:hypothetical protein
VGALAQSLTHLMVEGVEGPLGTIYVLEDTKLAQHHMGRAESMAGFNEAQSAFVVQVVTAVAVTEGWYLVKAHVSNLVVSVCYWIVRGLEVVYSSANPEG